MKVGVRTGAMLAVVFAAAIVAYRTLHHAPDQVIPAVVLRGADARKLTSNTFSARFERFLQERFPPQESQVGNPRLVALTFDDGPYPVETPLLLDELESMHVQATFFLIGHDTEMFPGLAQRIESDGDEIANHTLTHPADFDALDGPAVTQQLTAGAAVLSRYVHDPAIHSMMRPPHGRFTLNTLEVAQRDGYDVILWNDDPGDWRSVSPERILEHMEANASAPEIVLLHSGRLNTIEALPEMVTRFRRAGFTFVTVGRLLQLVPTAELLHPAKLRV